MDGHPSLGEVERNDLVHRQGGLLSGQHQETLEVRATRLEREDGGVHLRHISHAAPVVARRPHPLPLVQDPIHIPVHQGVYVEPHRPLQICQVPRLQLPEADLSPLCKARVRRHIQLLQLSDLDPKLGEALLQRLPAREHLVVRQQDNSVGRELVQRPGQRHSAPEERTELLVWDIVHHHDVRPRLVRDRPPLVRAQPLLVRSNGVGRVAARPGGQRAGLQTGPPRSIQHGRRQEAQRKEQQQ
mmetsp:Transcript_144329/g.462333  ORF Transcript_144329/g.462333 Transcript_144329/m.462333 type:complete len:243 (-) Transcript_144329:435-1163(-)